ncbi:hypothetical protein FRAHR75_420005 [Frankia sp. Hr75.2]|nr:hypothetical protein FRAHR75_420005 [Frankia sp. Hr75.2]
MAAWAARATEDDGANRPREAPGWLRPGGFVVRGAFPAHI